MENQPEDKIVKKSVDKSQVALREEEILAFWNERGIFKKSIDKEPTAGNFVFYDGPPFATGLPHYGHILPGTAKDVIPRYQTMRGKRVLRRWGWDCHGLPVENLIEKELGLKSKKNIEEYGVKKFNAAARASVFRYSDEWKRIIPRLGRWVDMENDYRTMDTSYTESVWWSFKTLFDKNLIYKGFLVMQVCPRCETTLSNMEVNLGYKDITDVSVYAKFRMEDGAFFVAWTTTPWTLPGNIALAVNPEVMYVRVKIGEEEFIVGKDSLENLKGLFSEPVQSNQSNRASWNIIEEFSGSDLVGKSYTPVFLEMKTWMESTNQIGHAKNKNNAWKIYPADFVTTDAGTGIVHIAPMYGDDDFKLAEKYDLPKWHHVGMDGVFKKEFVPEHFWGRYAKPRDNPALPEEKDAHQSTDIEVIKYLAKQGTLFAKKKIIHSYPHCWRCETPLLNYATSSWFVRVSELKAKMSLLNNGVSWIPKEIGSGRFGNWIEGARDWAISRSRYWGAPLPVWQLVDSEEVFVAGSIDDIKGRIKKSGNRYFVARHGETEGNVKKVWSTKSQQPDPLTENGKKEVMDSALKLKDMIGDQKIDLVFVSPYPRTQETANIFIETLAVPLDNIMSEIRLGEWNVGDEFNGKNIEDFFAIRNKSADRYQFKADDGESYADVVRRAGHFLYDLEKKYSGKNILIVSHGAPARALSFVANGFLRDRATEYMATFKNFRNAEIRELDFTPLPHNDDFEVDLHRPFIDEVEIFAMDGVSLMKRIPEVFDTWYDSGSMPFAQNHYPFENKEMFEQEGGQLFPADFIAEGLDQTRGWFYTMLVLGTGLFETSPYKQVVVNGLVLAEDGRKMSKSLKNYPDPSILIDKYGADIIRYYMMSSSAIEGEDLNFSEKGVDELYKKVILRLQNVVAFYELYADEKEKENIEEVVGVDVGESMQKNVLDAWIFLRLVELRNTITLSLDEYKIDKAARPILDFVDDLSTWYLRRSRDRFKSDNQHEKDVAVKALGIVLCEFSKLIAPFMPFISEDIYGKVKNSHETKESVHLAEWPVYDVKDSLDLEGTSNTLLADMMKVRETVTLVLEARQKAGIKVRQPLAALIIKENLSQELRTILAEEVNVKEVVSNESMEIPFELDIDITPELREEGIARDLIRGVQEMRKEKNLIPKDSIVLTLVTDNNGEEIVNKWKEQIMKITNVRDFVFLKDDSLPPKDGKEILAEGITFQLFI